MEHETTPTPHSHLREVFHGAVLLTLRRCHEPIPINDKLDQTHLCFSTDLLNQSLAALIVILANLEQNFGLLYRAPKSVKE